ncbi:MAG TPA: ATP-binding cassette domain-containing protein [Thermoanaerobaculia bacterium]|nr:ATP-binding cassette domain-containing protein [Thermoanaerobaculia bacterium]
MLALDAVVKSFGEVRALDGASLVLHAGEIHALVGENGAGKSTLVSIAAGLLSPDASRIELDGCQVRFLSARQARAAGIVLVPQHDLLVGAASVADNLALLDPAAHAFETRRTRRERVVRVAGDLGLDVGPADARADELPVGTRQRIEIAGALLSDPRVLVLDEPTAVLSPDETEALFRVLRRRARNGRAVLVITHRISEVFAAADRLTLLSRGRTVLTSPVADALPEQIAALLLGGSEDQEREPSNRGGGAGGTLFSDRAALELKAFRPRGIPEAVDLALAPGEVVTLLAIDGNGADVLAAAAAGLGSAEGSVSVAGVPVPTGSPRAFRAAGGRFVPGDRRKEGVIAGFTIAENLALAEAGGFLLDRARLAETARARIAAFGIRAPSPETRAGHLSGGNQQKLVLARELAGEARALVAIHPTRGLDLGSSAEVRKRITSACRAGTAVLLVSAEPEDAIAFGGAIRVVTRGRLGRDVSGEPPATLAALMAGLGDAGPPGARRTNALPEAGGTS